MVDRRLIDVNDVYALFEENGTARLHVSDIDAIPRVNAVDVVEVVRCVNCKFALPMTKTEKLIYCDDCIMCSQITPDGSRIAMFSNSYCNYGEKKESAKNE